MSTLLDPEEVESTFPTFDQYRSARAGEDPLKVVQSYSDDMRVNLLKTGEYSDELADEIDGQLFRHSVKNQWIDGADEKKAQEQFYRRSTDADATDAGLISRTAMEQGDTATEDIARQYKASLSSHVKEAYGNTEEYDAHVEGLRAQYQSIATPEKVNAARREALNRGDLPFAKFTDAEGNSRLELGAQMKDLAGDDEALAAMFEANPSLDKSAIREIRGKLQTPKGFDTPMFVMERQHDFIAALEKDADFKDDSRLKDLITVIAKGQTDNLDGAIAHIATSFAGKPFEEQFDVEERKTFLKDYATRAAINRVDITDKSMDANLRKLSTGEVVVPNAVIMSKSLFDRTMAESTIMPEEQKAHFQKVRTGAVEQFAPTAFKTITARRPDFVDHMAAQKAAGKTDVEILDEWTSDPKNQSTAWEYVTGIAESIPAAVATAVAAVPALAGSETAADVFGYYDRKGRERREFANLIGKDLGAGYDIGTMIAPVVADLLVTKGAATAIRLTVGAAARMAVKPIVQGFFGAAVKSETKSLMGSFAKGAAKRTVQREITDAGLGTLAAGQADNLVGMMKPSEIISRVGLDIENALGRAEYGTAMFASGFNRSAGQSYVQMHSTLEGAQNEDGSRKFSDEQVRDMALKHATMVGTMTGLTTIGFQALGLAGTEKIFNGGLTRKQLGQVHKRLAADWKNMAPSVVKDIDMKSAETMLASMMKKSMTPLWKVGVQGGLEEMPEEASQQFLEEIMNSYTTGDKFDVAAAMKSSLYAGMLGGVMGGGVNVGVQTLGTSKVTAQQEDAVRRSTLIQSAQKLRKANAPESAAALEQLAMQAPTERGVPEGTAPAGSEPPSGDAELAGTGEAVEGEMLTPEAPAAQVVEPAPPRPIPWGGLPVIPPPPSPDPNEPRNKEYAKYKAIGKAVAEWDAQYGATHNIDGAPKSDAPESDAPAAPTPEQVAAYRDARRQEIVAEWGSRNTRSGLKPGTPAEVREELETITQDESGTEGTVDAAPDENPVVDAEPTAVAEAEAAAPTTPQARPSVVAPDGSVKGVPADKLTTPMMKSWVDMNNDAPEGAIVMVRLGDFYEVFGEDAKVAAKLMQVALTKRNGIPMAGVPYHAKDSYLKKLTDAGHTVALAERQGPVSRSGDGKRSIAEVRAPEQQSTPTTPQAPVASNNPPTPDSATDASPRSEPAVASSSPKVGDPITFTSSVPGTQTPTQGVIAAIDAKGRITAQVGKTRYPNARVVTQDQTASTSVPEQMTVEHAKERHAALISEASTPFAGEEMFKMRWQYEVMEAVKRRAPVSVAALDYLGFPKGVEGYVRQGDLYVYQSGQTEISNPEAVIAAADIDPTPAERIVTDALTDSDVPEAALAETPGGKEALAEVINEAAPEIITDGMPLGTMVGLGVVSENVKTLVAAKGGSAPVAAPAPVAEVKAPRKAPPKKAAEVVSESRAIKQYPKLETRFEKPVNTREKGWVLVEAKTGLAIGRGATKQEAIGEAERTLLWQQGWNEDYPSVYEMVDGAIERDKLDAEPYGISEKYKPTRDELLTLFKRRKAELETQIEESIKSARRVGAQPNDGVKWDRQTVARLEERIAKLEASPDSDPDPTAQSIAATRDQLKQMGAPTKADTRFTPENSPITAELTKFGGVADIKAFLKNVAAKGKPEHRELAKILLRFPDVLVTPVHLQDAAFAGTFVPQTGQILINTARPGPRGGVDTVLHELVHAATQASIENPTPAQVAILKRLDRIRQSVLKKTQGGNLRYGLSDLHEFVSHWFTSPQFQREVAALTPKGEKNWLHVIIDTIRDLLNGRTRTAADKVSAEIMRDMLTLMDSVADTSRMGQLLMQPADMRDESRFAELTRDVTPENVEAWKAENPGKYAELRSMRERVLRDAGYVSETLYHHGGFDANEDPVPLVGDGGMHFGTKEASEARAYGKPVDDFINSIEVEFDEELDAWFWKADSVDSYDLDEKGFQSEVAARTDAETYAQQSSEYEQSAADELGNFTTAKLRMASTKRTKDQGASWVKAIADAKREGHDSIAYLNEFEDKGSTSYIVFDPNQIKSTEPLAFDSDNRLITPDQWGDTTSSDIRMQIPAEDDFNNEIEKYVTGNWPADPAERVAEAIRFADEWLARSIPSIRRLDWVLTRPSADNMGSGRHDTAIGRGGQVHIEISDSVFARAGIDNMAEGNAKTYIARTIEEELIHASHLESQKRKFKASRDVFRDVYNDTLATYDEIVADTGLTRKTADASFAAYTGPDSTKKITELLPNQQLNVVGEMVRQIVQLRRSGDITESASANILGKITEWLKGYLDALKFAAKNISSLGSRVQADIRATEQVMKEVNFQPSEETESTPSSPDEVRLIAAGFAPEGETLNLNYDQLAEDVADLSPVNAENVIRSMVNREVSHNAGLAALSDVTPEEAARLRDMHALIATGNTTGREIAFYRTNPSAMQRLVEYLKGAVRSMYARVKLNFDPRSAVYFDRLSVELAKAKDGYKVRSHSKPFDPEAPLMQIPAAEDDLAPLSSDSDFDAFSHTQFTEVHNGDKLYTSTEKDMAKKNWFQRMFTTRDDMSRSWSALRVDRDAAVKVIQNKVEIAERLYAKAIKTENPDMDQVRMFVGSTAPLLTPGEETRLDTEYQARIESVTGSSQPRIDEARKTRDKDLRSAKTDEEKQATWANYEMSEADARNREADALRDVDTWLATEKNKSMIARAKVLRDQRDRAAQYLSENAPTMKHALSLLAGARDEIQAKLARDFKDSDPGLSWVIDRSNGVYLVRSYKFHNDPLRGEKLMNDPAYDELRGRLIDFFGKQLAEDEFKELRANPAYEGDTDDTLRALARINTQDMAKGKFEDYVMSHEGKHNMGSFSEGVRIEIERFMKKKNLDPAITELLGEIDDPLFNATNTLAAVSNLLFTHRMTKAMREDGLRTGTLITKEQMESNTKYRDWKPLKAESAHSPAYRHLGGLYASPDTKRAFDAAFRSLNSAPTNTAGEAMVELNKFILGASGKSMGVMILGNPGAYVRNIFSNSLIAASQGANPFSAKGYKSAMSALNLVLKRGEGDQEFIEKMIAFRVLGDGVNISYMRELLSKYRESPSSATQWLAEKGESISPESMEALRKAGDGGGKFLNALSRASEFTETYIGPLVFLNELDALVKAGIPQREAEQEAARITKMVIPGKTEQSQAITGVGKHPISALVAPFLGFKSEMFRTVINTWKIGLEHANSDNPALRAHGIKRLSSAAMIQGGVTMGMSFILQALAGISDDEDQAIRAAMPSYSRNSTFWYRRKGDNTLQTVDLTFTIPYSLNFDVFTQSFKALFNNRMGDIPEIWTRLVTDEIIGEQIVAGTLMDVARNKDQNTGNEIWLEVDGLSDRMTKSALHVFNGSYNPAVVKKSIQAYQAIDRPSKNDEPFFFTPAGIMAAMALPAKPRDHDIQKLATRAFRSVNAKNQQLWAITNKLSSPQGMSEGTPTELLRERTDAHVKVWTEAYKLAQAYKSLGIPAPKVLAAMMDAGLSRERSQLAMQGLTNIKALPAETMSRVREIDQKRYDELLEATRQQPRMISLKK